LIAASESTALVIGVASAFQIRTPETITAAVKHRTSGSLVILASMVAGFLQPDRD
jgi:hypothetical protein